MEHVALRAERPTAREERVVRGGAARKRSNVARPDRLEGVGTRAQRSARGHDFARLAIWPPSEFHATSMLSPTALSSQLSVHIQRGRVALTLPEKPQGLFGGLSVLVGKTPDPMLARDYIMIQNILITDRLFGPALLELEQELVQAMKNPPPKSGPGPVDYLDLVLLRTEQAHGINVKGAPVLTATLTAAAFKDVSSKLVVAQDPGAYAGHGEYTHRLQWYVILYYHDRKVVKSDIDDLLLNMTNPLYSPAKGSWPVQPGQSEPQPEGSGTVWDAVLDRQHSDKFYRWLEDGITHPEMFMAALIGNRSTSDANAQLQKVLPILSQMVKARYDVVVGKDSPADNRERAEREGYTQALPDVWYKL